MSFIPMVVKKIGQSERSYDLFSLLLHYRIVFVSGKIDDVMANSICAQLIYLESENAQNDIHLYINSPGGVINAALAIYDTMQFVKPQIQTWGIGLAASCASFLLAAGEKGKRHSLPNTRIMLHEPWGGFQGRSQHMEDHAKEAMFMRKHLTDIYHNHTGQKKEQISQWLDRETFFSAEEAKQFGLVDEVCFLRPQNNLGE